MLRFIAHDSSGTYLLVPRSTLVGVAACRWVARNRYRLSRCRILRSNSDRSTSGPAVGDNLDHQSHSTKEPKMTVMPYAEQSH